MDYSNERRHDHAKELETSLPFCVGEDLRFYPLATEQLRLMLYVDE